MIPTHTHPVTGQPIKLGKKAKRVDPRTFQLRKYLAPFRELPTPPDEVSYVTQVPSWPMLGNDLVGDCVEAAMGHIVQQQTCFSKGLDGMKVMTEAEAIALYGILGGYVPGDPSTDNGTDMLTALNYWRKTGITVAGENHKIVAFAEVDPTNALEVQQAIWLFGSLFTGIALPISAQGQANWTVADGGIYSPIGQPGSWGGHCVPTVARSPITLTEVTWGGTLKMSHNFGDDYIDELYVVLSDDWAPINNAQNAAFDHKALLADLASL